MSGFEVVTDALVEFAGAVDGATAELGALDPSTAVAEVPAAVPGTATAAAAGDLAIRLTVACQALAETVAEVAGAARGNASTYASSDGRVSQQLITMGSPQ